MREFALFSAAIAIALVAAPACSSDWSVRTAADAGVSSDASVDGSTGDASPAGDAGSDAAADCASLLAAAADKKSQAITCTLGDVSSCSTSVKDECGCTIFVGTAGSPAANDYASAVAAAISAGCTDQCVGCTAPPTRGTCIENGASFTCSPP